MMPPLTDQTVAVPLRLFWPLAAFTLLGVLVALFEATQWCAGLVRRLSDQLAEWLLGRRGEW